MSTDDSRLPAPGSTVPGAPPALQRPLTPSDGTVDAEPAGRSPGSAADTTSIHPSAVSTPRAPYLVAATLAGVAVGIELSGLLRRPGRRF